MNTFLFVINSSDHYSVTAVLCKYIITIIFVRIQYIQCVTDAVVVRACLDAVERDKKSDLRRKSVAGIHRVRCDGCVVVLSRRRFAEESQGMLHATA